MWKPTNFAFRPTGATEDLVRYLSDERPSSITPSVIVGTCATPSPDARLEAMRYNENAPATRKDVQLLVEHLGQLYVANCRWKEEIAHEIKVLAESIRPAGPANSPVLTEQTDVKMPPMVQLSGA